MNTESMSMTEKIKYVQDTLYVISGKWKLPILMTMYAGKTRFKDIQRAIPAISTRGLSRELKELETNHLISRTVHDDWSTIIEYTLKNYSNTLKPVVDIMVEWGCEHRRKIIGRE